MELDECLLSVECEGWEDSFLDITMITIQGGFFIYFK